MTGSKNTRAEKAPRNRLRSGERISWVSFILVAAVAAVVILPIWWIFRSSLMSNSELYAYPPSFFPQNWRWSNYAATLETFKFWQ